MNWIEKEYVNQTTELGSIMRTTELQLDRYEKYLRSIYENTELLKTLQKGEQEKTSLDYVKMTEWMRSIQKSEK